MGANSLTFTGNLTIFKGFDETSSNFALKIQNSNGDDLFTFRNDGLITAIGRIEQIGLGNSTYFGKDAGLNDDLTTNNITAIGFEARHCGVDESAQNRITQVLGANTTCGPEEAAAVRRALPGASALLLQLEVAPELSLEAAKEARSQGVTVMLDPGPVRPLPDGLLSLCDVLTPNETEAQALAGFPVAGPESAARAASVLLEQGVGTVVVKLGAQGAYFANDDSQGVVPPFSVDAVDSVAAGDAFNGALAVSLAEGLRLEAAVTVACAAGALAVTQTGAQDSMPQRRLVEELLRSQRP